jgi:type II secretion system protein I
MKVGKPGGRYLGGEGGLTLLEVVVALAILAIGIVSILRAFSSSMLTSKAAETRSYAAILTSQVASELERRTDLQPGKLSGGFAEAGPGYTWAANIERANSQGLLRAEITVVWPEGSRSRHMTMITCLRPADQNGEEITPPPVSNGGAR